MNISIRADWLKCTIKDEKTMCSVKPASLFIITNQISVFDEHIQWSHGHYEHFHKSRFIKMYTKRQKHMIS